MQTKAILTLTLAAAFLVGCASIEKQTIDGKEREVFTGVVGAWTKDGETLDSFNAVSRPCQSAAIVEVDSWNKHLDRFIPLNIPARTRYTDAIIEQTEACLKTAGYTQVRRSKGHSSSKEK